MAASRPRGPLSKKLGLNSNHLPRLNHFDRLQSIGNEWQEIFECVARCAEHHNAEFPIPEILLEFEVLIARHDDGEASGFRCAEQRAVLKPSPRLLLNGSNFVAG